MKNIRRSNAALPCALMAALVLAATFLAPAVPAFAANKDMIQLQTQVQQLQDAIARLQQSNDERMGVMKDLVQQTADSVNKMSLVVATLQQQMQTQQEAQNAKLDQVSGQMQSLNDSLDELKARLTSIDKSIQAIQNQQQSINATIQNNAPVTTTAPAAAQPAAPTSAQPTQDNPAPLPAPAESDLPRAKPSAAIPSAAPASAPSGVNAPPAEDLYKTALGDYMGARYALATAEFSDVVKFYPDNTLAGNASYYLGEIAYRAGKYPVAVKSYDKVIEQYPGNNKIPPAELHKGQALFALKQNDAGIRELRALIQRFPNSPEAMQARSRLSGMGVPVIPRHN